MKWLDLYHSSPQSVKNIFATTYGFLQKKRRYGNRHSFYLSELRKTQWLSRPEIDQIVELKLKKILIHAFQNVPYYEREFISLDINPFKDNPFSIVKKLPVLEKKTVILNPDLFISKTIGKHTISHTSGSTGTPLRLYLSHQSEQYNYALLVARLLDWAGLDTKDKKVMFGGQLVTPIDREQPPFWVNNYYENQLYCSSYHMSPTNLENYYLKIKSFKPAYLTGYASSIYLFSQYMIQTGKKIKSIKAILPSSETLSPTQRKLMERAFDCKVYNSYSLSEYVNFASECKYGTMHISPEAGMIHILDDNGKTKKNGEIGNLISTTLFNDSMPLIKYNTGDLAVLEDKECRCGRHLPVLKTIIGRQDDYLIALDGSKVGRLDPVFKNINGIIEAQIVQNKLNEIDVFIVPSLNFTKSNELKIINNLKNRVGENINVKVKKSSMIKRNHNGKFKSVICKIK